MSGDLNYSSAFVNFLDRESGEVKTTMMYPITKIVLNDVVGDQVAPARTFIVHDGKWVEQQ